MFKAFCVTLAVLLGSYAAIWVTVSGLTHPKATNPCTLNRGDCYSSQGLYSHEDCSGQHPWYIWVDTRWVFMGCRE